MNILASVFDKNGLDSFLKDIIRDGDIVYATGKTAEFLKSSGIDAISTSKLSGFDELLGGRVKTLVPSIFAGILSNRDARSNEELKAMKYPQFDMVISNLYPFHKTAAGGDLDEMVENIDIGGISLIRAAAKNIKQFGLIKTGIPTDSGEFTPVDRSIDTLSLLAREGIGHSIPYHVRYCIAGRSISSH